MLANAALSCLVLSCCYCQGVVRKTSATIEHFLAVQLNVCKTTATIERPENAQSRISKIRLVHKYKTQNTQRET